jgi:hypothetical protein
MTRFRFTCSALSSLLAAGALLFVTGLAPAAFGGTASAAAAARSHTSKGDKSKPCYETGTYDHKTVRVPTSCAKPESTLKCFLTSTYAGKKYREQINCTNTAVTKGSGGSGGQKPTTPGSGSTGTGAPGSGATSPGLNEGINWATSSSAICGDGSTATSTDGSSSCTDGSWPYCSNGTDYVVVDPEDQQVVCLPDASVPSTGVCDDGSMPTSGGTDTDGTPLCADGDDAYLPGDTADDSASYATCDDGSDPGDGGTDASGTALCADGTYPSYGD